MQIAGTRSSFVAAFGTDARGNYRLSLVYLWLCVYRNRFLYFRNHVKALLASLIRTEEKAACRISAPTENKRRGLESRANNAITIAGFARYHKKKVGHVICDRAREGSRRWDARLCVAYWCTGVCIRRSQIRICVQAMYYKSDCGSDTPSIS